VIALELLWWAGGAYFMAWSALPLLLVPRLGIIPGIIIAMLLMPWSSLAGMALLHRLLPASETGRFRMFADRGSVRWALKGWAPGLFLTVFQPVFFLSAGFQRLALRAFGASLGAGAWVTSRTIVREPHHIRIGPRALLGEHAHLACSYQPRPGTLVVERIEIGAETLIGAYCILAAGVRVGAHCVVEHAVDMAAHVQVGDDSRIGSRTSIYNGARIGSRVRIGKHCVILAGVTVADDAIIPDGMMVSRSGSNAREGRCA
jgi:acetyltransferase-like isoleucine patch superfamily enzyme